MLPGKGIEDFDKLGEYVEGKDTNVFLPYPVNGIQPHEDRTNDRKGLWIEKEIEKAFIHQSVSICQYFWN